MFLVAHSEAFVSVKTLQSMQKATFWKVEFGAIDLPKFRRIRKPDTSPQ